MARLSIWLLLILGLPGFVSFACASDVQFAKINQETISFSVPEGSHDAVPKSVKTGLYDLEYISALHPADGSMPYFLFFGNPCASCKAERALYLIRPKLKGKAAITSFVQPGKIFDPRTRALVMRSRAFYGHCLIGHRDDVYVLFQRERIDHFYRHRHHHYYASSVYIADASPDFLRDKLLERHFPSLLRTLALVRHKKCHEVKRRNRFMPRKPPGIDWPTPQPSGDASAAAPRTDIQ